MTGDAQWVEKSRNAMWTHKTVARFLGSLYSYRTIFQQKLMRHASAQTTMNVYGTALLDSKRQANSKVVQMVLGAVGQKERGRVVATP